MFVFHFRTFLGQLLCDAPTDEGIPAGSPILIYYFEKEDLTKHEMLRRFNNLLVRNNLIWLRPLRELTNEWIIDLKLFKLSYPVLQHSEYLKGKVTIEPEYKQDKEVDEYTEDILSIVSRIHFSIYPNEVLYQQSSQSIFSLDELKLPLDRFHRDFNNPSKCGFLMMKFEDSTIQTNIVTILKQQFKLNGYEILRADDKWYSDDLLINIRTYMHACSFGIALFERINTNYFNPNVSLEIGYLMALNKPILFLKDKTLMSLHTDLVGRLYSEFDFQNLEYTLKNVTEKWLGMNFL